MPEHFILFDRVCKYYQMGQTQITAADEISFFVEKGEFCVIVGPLRRRKNHCAEHAWRDGPL